MNYIVAPGLGKTEGSQIVQYIINESSRYWGVPKERILNKLRKKESVDIRHICMYLSRKYTDLTYEEIGKKIGGCGHSNVVTAIKRVKDSTRLMPAYRSKIVWFENKLDAAIVVSKKCKISPTILSVKNLDNSTLKYRLKSL